MTTIDADYLIVGGGAAGMAFAESDADVVMMDRRHRPGASQPRRSASFR